MESNFILSTLYSLYNTINTIDNTITNSTNNTTNNTTICHSILFSNLSRESNPKIENDMCPDTLISFSLMLIFLIFYLLLLTITSIAILWKRQSGNIQARSISHLFLTMFSSCFFVIIFSLRIVIGRKIFPCSLYTLSFFVAGPLTSLPTSCRCLKLFGMYKLNVMKTRFILDGNESSNESGMSMSSVSGGNSEEELKESNGLEEFKKRLITNKEWRLFKFYQFMTSHTFVISAYGLCFLSQILFWILLGGIDEIIHTTTKKENDPRFFVIPGFFQFSYGCIGSNAMFGIIIAEALVYYIAEWITLVLCIKSDRDTWNIKKETLVHVIVQPFLVILFIVLGAIPVIAELVDYFVPYLLVLLLGSVFEIVVCVVLPVCYDIKLDSGLLKSKNEFSEKSFGSTEILLKDPKAYSIFLDFARRSYTPEPVLCYTDLQKFKKLNKKFRKEKALEIVDNYITLNAPLELNLQNINDKRRDLLNIIESNQEIPINLFEHIETCCLQDLLDLQQRLVDQNDFIASLVG